MGRTSGAFGSLVPEKLEAIRSRLAESRLDGWLLTDLHHQNPVAASLLGIEGSTRRYFVVLPARGAPAALVHGVDVSLWRDWPWSLERYSGWRNLEALLPDLLAQRRKLALETSPGGRVPALDRVPAGILEWLRGLGLETHCSGDLVTDFHARWNEEQLARHRGTAQVLARIAHEAFERAAHGVREGEPMLEGALAEWIRGRLHDSGVAVGADCIVAVGRTASDPHYQPRDGGEPIGRDELLLVDLWGKPSAADVPADQTWMAYLGGPVPGRIQEVWEAVRDARDRALDLLESRTAEGAEVRGFEVDRASRDLIRERGLGEYFVHRTGHSIDRELHGSGPNLDDLETRDDRRLLEGVGFSVEPGVYVPGELGIRSEVNVYLGAAGPEVTTPDPQEQILRPLEG